MSYSIQPLHLGVSLPKTLSKLTRGLRRNQNIIAHDCAGAPVPPPAVRPLQATTAAGSRDSSAAASAQYFAPVCTENSNSDIMVMQSAKDRVGMDTSSSLNWAREWRVLI